MESKTLASHLQLHYLEDEYNILDTTLGGGNFSVVHQAHSKETGARVAVKEIKNEEFNGSEGISKNILREVTILRKLAGHPYIISFVGLKLTPRSLGKPTTVSQPRTGKQPRAGKQPSTGSQPEPLLCMIFECADCDLKAFIKEFPKSEEIPHDTIKSLMYQLLKGIEWCHGHGVLHRDLKPQNLLFWRGTETLKIADFGLSREMAADVPYDENGYTNTIQSLHYKAPEILVGDTRYTTSVDIWSVGCIFAELITKEILFRANEEIKVLHCIFKVLGSADESMLPGVDQLHSDYEAGIPQFEAKGLGNKFQNIGYAGLDLLSQMLQIPPAMRISAKKALQHEYFADFDKTGGSNTIA